MAELTPLRPGARVPGGAGVPPPAPSFFSISYPAEQELAAAAPPPPPSPLPCLWRAVLVLPALPRSVAIQARTSVTDFGALTCVYFHTSGYMF